jgi:hypothetical protein
MCQSLTKIPGGDKAAETESRTIRIVTLIISAALNPNEPEVAALASNASA